VQRPRRGSYRAIKRKNQRGEEYQSRKLQK
jgi:hypothetical protein